MPRGIRFQVFEACMYLVILPDIARLYPELVKLNPPTLDPLSESALEYRVVSIAFLPDEVDRAEKILAEVLEQAMGDVTWLNRRADYDRFLDALTAVKAQAGIKNTATAFGLLLDAAEKSIGEMDKTSGMGCR